jgi:acetyl/propionyl-CoA carboxylase alpha subunit
VPPIRKLLVANRGEIATRIFRTCDRLGIATVAVAAPDDVGAFHTRQAGHVELVRSYLASAEMVEAARRSGADAIHPGYGFLAERAELAEAVGAADLTWVGPPPEALRASGDKLEARRRAELLGIPVLAGHVAGTDPGTGPKGPAAAAELGFPLLVKAAAGGGGRGMRVVRSPEELAPAVEAARRETKAAFADDTIFFERYLERPRHIEVQLLADKHGRCLALGERECSIQRRYQKVLEESPSPAVGDELRARLSAAALALAGDVGYVGAGTAEFLVHGDEFFFLELNARLQVEHPVTELVTGLDLVEEQLRVAAGEAVGGAPGRHGHAVEARLYAEHPLTFLPQAGRVRRLCLPSRIRVDQGVDEGDEAPIAYDPLLAKLVAGGETRDEALSTLSSALRETEVAGVTTNLPFLRWLADHPELRAGRTTTAFLFAHPPLSRYPRLAAPWTGSWRENAAPAPVGPAPTVEAHARDVPTGAEETAVRAPIPGVVLRLLAAEGDEVQPRQPLLLLEAMKMETPLLAPLAGVVRHVHVAEGDRVATGALLVELGSAPADTA